MKLIDVRRNKRNFMMLESNNFRVKLTSRGSLNKLYYIKQKNPLAVEMLRGKGRTVCNIITAHKSKLGSFLYNISKNVSFQVKILGRWLKGFH